MPATNLAFGDHAKRANNEPELVGKVAREDPHQIVSNSSGSRRSATINSSSAPSAKHGVQFFRPAACAEDMRRTARPRRLPGRCRLPPQGNRLVVEDELLTIGEHVVVVGLDVIPEASDQLDDSCF